MTSSSAAPAAVPAAGSRGVLLVLNGPNLNLLGTREPAIYGHATLQDVERLTADAATQAGFETRFVQSNHEGALLDALHAARGTAVAVIINAGAYTHTSVALRDALTAIELPAVEVHISNVHQREEFRHHSYLSAVCAAVIVGAGVHGYALAVSYLDQALP